VAQGSRRRVHAGAFDALLSALVSEHLLDLRRFFGEAFDALRWSEHRGDAGLAAEVPGADKYLGRPLLLLVEARRAA